jgi:hypothetical protein
MLTEVKKMQNIPAMLAKPLMRRNLTFLLALFAVHGLEVPDRSKEINGHEYKIALVRILITKPIAQLKEPNQFGTWFFTNGDIIPTLRWRRTT